MNIPKLENITLLGTGIAENLGDMLVPLRGENIKSIDLRYNGIEQACFTSYFKHMINYDHIHTLNISSNWFGTDGMFEI